MRACPVRRGFTLVEMIMVATLFSILAAGVASSFLSGMRLWGRAQQQDAAYADTLVSLEAIAKELRQSVALPAIGFEGEARKVSFASLSGTSVMKVAYEFDAHKKTLWRRRVALKEVVAETLQPDTIEQRALAADRVTITFGVFNPNEAEGIEWKDEWKPEDGVPLAIRFEVERNHALLAKTVFLPIA